MDPNNHNTIESFVQDFQRVADIIRQRNPSCIIAPMIGAIPFIDILTIVDDEFPNEKVEYVPASNKIYRVRDVLRAAFVNLITSFWQPEGSFLSIDEVVSGNSAVRVYTQFDAARTIYANKATLDLYGPDADFNKDEVRGYRNNLRDSIRYNTIGIVDQRMKKKKKTQNRGYLALEEQGIVIPVETECIVTMDRKEFFPANYRRVQDKEGKDIYLPIVDDFVISANYIDFLHKVADILGKDRGQITVRNIGKIRDSYLLVPEGLRTM